MIRHTIKIWEKDINDRDYQPLMETYILEGQKVRGAVLICPGGGYRYTSAREGEPVALKLNKAGFHAFVLNYRVSPDRHPLPLLDVSKAMCIIRQHADDWRINEEQIAVCGFSAGGHLTASLGVHWDKPYIQKTLESGQGMNRPNALILCYPVISSGKHAHKGSFENLLGSMPSAALFEELSLEKHITKKTPPTFLWHTFADQSVPVENSLLFAQALRANDVPFEMHIYPSGNHGLSLATKECDDETDYPHVASWFDLCIKWMEDELEWN